MNVRKNRFALIFVATIGACLIVASTEAQTSVSAATTKTHRSPGSNPSRSDSSSHSHSATTQSYGSSSYNSFDAAPPATQPTKPTAPLVYISPVLSTALPTTGLYQGGLKIGRQRDFVVQPVSFTTPSPRRSTPFPTLDEQINRASSVLKSPESYLGDSYRATGQGAARLAVRRAVYGDIGLSGVLINVDQ